MGLLDRIFQAAGGAVGSVTVESALTPPIVVEQPLAGSGAADGGAGARVPWLVRLVRPRVTVELPTGPLVIQPAGEPPAVPWLGAVAFVGGVAILALAAYGAAALAKGGAR